MSESGAVDSDDVPDDWISCELGLRMEDENIFSVYTVSTRNEGSRMGSGNKSLKCTHESENLN